MKIILLAVAFFLIACESPNPKAVQKWEEYKNELLPEEAKYSCRDNHIYRICDVLLPYGTVFKVRCHKDGCTIDND